MFEKMKKWLTRSENPNSPRYRREAAERAAGHHIKYVTERRDGVEEVIGKSGALNIRDDELLVFASADVLMRCKIADLEISELLSKDGVILKGPDLEHGGEVRTVTAFYVYYR